MKIKPRQVVIIVLVVISAIILFQNTDIVIIRLLLWEISMSRILLILFFLMTGFVIGLFTARSKRRAVNTRESLPTNGIK